MTKRLRIISPKRNKRLQTGWEGFFPYYAGYPEFFARELLQSAKLASGAVVLDPWNGSGTTTYTATSLGLAGQGDAELVGDGEIRQPLSPGVVPLRKKYLLVRAMQRPPVGDPPFQGAPYAVGHDLLAELVLQSLEDANRHQPGGSVQQFENTGPYGDQRVLPCPP